MCSKNCASLINLLENRGIVMQKAETQRLVTALFNNDDAEINRIVSARLESQFKRRVEETSKAVFESMLSDQEPQFG